MEEKMKKKTCTVSNRTSSALVMHRDSQVISKVKPKIRIIHIFTPEIIKTDAANFRELVQRLTGKPTEGNNTMKKPRLPRKEEPRLVLSNKPLMIPKKMELRTGYRPLGFRERIKGEEEMCGGDQNSGGGGFLGSPSAGVMYLKLCFLQFH
ncbi:hypothetical protein F0562_017192 [Nyssa sinensis]|uniref:VQ domain-containing protein n=1 Tax=Nyssa sinensis TaxID=561372 RepID=A0A5J4ZEP4_9ASTE|nr:hypothetical protein F0562_017192 [Nyssa sinensis]